MLQQNPQGCPPAEFPHWGGPEELQRWGIGLDLYTLTLSSLCIWATPRNRVWPWVRQQSSAKSQPLGGGAQPAVSLHPSPVIATGRAAFPALKEEEAGSTPQHALQYEIKIWLFFPWVFTSCLIVIALAHVSRPL